MDIQTAVDRQRLFFEGGRTLDYEFRMRMLKRLRASIKKHENEIFAALKVDLNKAEFETYATEVGIVYEEITNTMKHLASWMKPKKVMTPLTQFPGTSRIYTEPYGVVLIMAPWNYPFQLAMVPLIGAICAGNCAVVKPSNYSPNVSAAIVHILSDAFRSDYILTVLGGRDANRDLLVQKFDYIFFTGSVAVGRAVMEAASKHLTPVSLELGGKSPCIVDQTADLKTAAKRIVWGKYLNAGQTCVAPDYLLVHSSVKERLLELMKKEIAALYGREPLLCEDFPKIINEKHFKRLLGLMDSGVIICGGGSVPEKQRIEPTILDQVTWNSAVMGEEIFGPILPVLTFERLDEVVRLVTARPKPLALYFFTRSRKNEAYIRRYISYGGGCINDTIVHLATTNMPFGGVGSSGMGGYHGKDSYLTFSHRKSIMKKANWLDLPFRYPPYKKLNLALVRLLMK